MENNFRILEEVIKASLGNTTEALVNESMNNSTENSIPQEPIGHGFLSAKTLIAIIILLLYTIATPIFEKLNFHYLHESGMCMILGFLVGLVSMLINPFVR